MRPIRLSGVVVIDKNIILYGYLNINQEYREICKNILLDGFNGLYTPVLINHILYELMVDLTTKYRLEENHIVTIIQGLIASEKWMKLGYNASTIERAYEILKTFGISPSTSLIIATMEEYNIKKIVSDREDLIVYPYVEVVNPFK